MSKIFLIFKNFWFGKGFVYYFPYFVFNLSSHSHSRNFSFPINLEHRKYYYTYLIKNENKDAAELDPWFIVGFVDGEGCFSINIIEKKTLKTGWEVRLCAVISIHNKDQAVLEKINKSLGVGKISSKGVEAEGVQWQVQDKKGIEKLISFLDKFPLITQKYADFLLFKKVFKLIEKKEHLTVEGLKKIMALKAKSNFGLSEKLVSAFPDVVPVERPLVKSKTIIDPNWLAGFTAAEGCFMISIFKSKTLSTGFQVKLIFQLTQDSRDEQLLMSFINYFNCGQVYSARTWCNFKVTKLEDIIKKIIPFFKKYQIHGTKVKDFEDWCKAAELIKDNKHLIKEGLEQIRKIKEGMNKGRK